MNRATRAVGVIAVALVLLAIAVVVGTVLVVEGGMFRGAVDPPGAETSEEDASAAAATEAGAHPSLLYGEVTTADGTTYEGRLRWGVGEEAFWGDTFNGVKDENPWAERVPPDELPSTRRSFTLFGIEIARRERPLDLGRPFMARFGDIRRIEAVGTDVRVTLKSGTVFDLDALDATDFDDGVRVWDRRRGPVNVAEERRGVVSLDRQRIRSIELLPAPEDSAASASAPNRLHGTVHTERGEFTGFLQWNREEGMGSDRLEGDGRDGPVSVRFDTVRSITRHSTSSSLVTLEDGRELLLAGTPETGRNNRGVYVDDPRYGRVLVSWDAFERVDFHPAADELGTGPAYDDFPPGQPLTGSVTTRDGHRLAGRLVYDLDESETTETLDAPAGGVTYILPFARVESIVLVGDDDLPGTADAASPFRPARVILRGGEELRLERRGDLGGQNAGLLVFMDDRERPEYVPWGEVERIDFRQPSALEPAPGDDGPGSNRPG